MRGVPDAEWLVANGLRLGRDVYLGRAAHFDTGWLWLITVEDGATITANVEILAHDASTKKLLGYTIVAPVTICRDAFIGNSAIILPGVTVGAGAIVGAGSVVRHDVPPGTIAVGNPARVVGDVAAYAERHRRLMEDAPVYPAEGWSVPGGIAPAQMRQMREQLAGVIGYVP
ncbi:MAG TPA: acyltransferase [Conexibacter sp.]|nr:acyltransferase [Conexibacter sp.]